MIRRVHAQIVQLQCPSFFRPHYILGGAKDKEIRVLGIKRHLFLTQPMDPEKKSLNFIFPTKYVTPKSLKFSHWLSEL